MQTRPSMATLSAAPTQGSETTVPRSKRKLQKHLRSAGLAYISRTGKLIPAKKVAEELCQCPQKCDDKVPMDARERLFNHFYGLGDADLQNAFLRLHMDVRARLNVTETPSSGGRSPRRITCKYLVPLLPTRDRADVCQKAFVSAFVITTKRVRLQREKLICSMGLNSYSSHGKARAHDNSNGYVVPAAAGFNIPSDCELRTEPDAAAAAAAATSAVTIKKVRQQTAGDVEGDEAGSEVRTTERDPTASAPDETSTATKRRKRRVVDDPLIPLGLIMPEGVTIAPVTASPDHDRDIAIVNNFFSNQLWKPEYIGWKPEFVGTYS